MPSFDDLPVEINELILQHANVLTSTLGLPRIHGFVNYMRDIRVNYSDFSLLNRTWRELIQRQLFSHPVFVVDYNPGTQRVLRLSRNLENAERIYRENPDLARYSNGADVKFVKTSAPCPTDWEAIRNLLYRVWMLLKQLALSSSRSILNSEGAIERTFGVGLITVNDYSSVGEPVDANIDCPTEFYLPEIGIPIRLNVNDTFDSQHLMSLELMTAILNTLPKLQRLEMGSHVFNGKDEFLKFFFSRNSLRSVQMISQFTDFVMIGGLNTP
ncbi:hypothetical protein V1525DRAFT_412975 [Lipomyces kononenkoae]|uniref:Uncharacterized protein n=1 Tax=Lipomyces kononenkoae TaxID=34357 RepID=A0ACC3SSV2_LIPKO